MAKIKSLISLLLASALFSPNIKAQEETTSTRSLEIIALSNENIEGVKTFNTMKEAIEYNPENIDIQIDVYNGEWGKSGERYILSNKKLIGKEKCFDDFPLTNELELKEIKDELTINGRYDLMGDCTIKNIYLTSGTLLILGNNNIVENSVFDNGIIIGRKSKDNSINNNILKHNGVINRGISIQYMTGEIEGKIADITNNVFYNLNQGISSEYPDLFFLGDERRPGNNSFIKNNLNIKLKSPPETILGKNNFWTNSEGRVLTNEQEIYQTFQITEETTDTLSLMNEQIKPIDVIPSLKVSPHKELNGVWGWLEYE